MQRSSSAPGVTRTPGQRFRKPLLYPPELRGQESRYQLVCAGGTCRLIHGRNLHFKGSFLKCLPCALSHDSERRLERVRGDHPQALDALDPRPWRACGDGCLESRQCIRFPGRRDFDVPVSAVLHPTCEAKLARLVDDVPPESDALHPAANFQMDALHAPASVWLPEAPRASPRYSSDPTRHFQVRRPHPP